MRISKIIPILYLNSADQILKVIYFPLIFSADVSDLVQTNGQNIKKSINRKMRAFYEICVTPEILCGSLAFIISMSNHRLYMKNRVGGVIDFLLKSKENGFSGIINFSN